MYRDTFRNKGCQQQVWFAGCYFTLRSVPVAWNTWRWICWIAILDDSRNIYGWYFTCVRWCVGSLAFVFDAVNGRGPEVWIEFLRIWVEHDVIGVWRKEIVCLFFASRSRPSFQCEWRYGGMEASEIWMYGQSCMSCAVYLQYTWKVDGFVVIVLENLRCSVIRAKSYT